MYLHGQQDGFHGALPQVVQAERLPFQRGESDGTVAKEPASAKVALAVLRAETDKLARQLPEYEAVRAMYGVGEKPLLS